MVQKIYKYQTLEGVELEIKFQVQKNKENIAEYGHINIFENEKWMAKLNLLWDPALDAYIKVVEGNINLSEEDLNRIVSDLAAVAKEEN
jgi:hypothetical protein